MHKTLALAFIRHLIGWPTLIFISIFSLPFELLGLFLAPVRAIMELVYTLELHIYDWIEKGGL